MLGAFIGTAAKAAVTGAAGLAVIGVLKESKVGAALREVAVTVTEAGVRGYKLVENGVEKVADVATDVFTEAKNRADEPVDVSAPVAAEPTATEPTVDDAVAEAEALIRDAAKDDPDQV